VATARTALFVPEAGDPRPDGRGGELAELFQWLSADEAVRRAAAEPLRTRVGEELADILDYLIRLADALDVDLAEAARSRISRASSQYLADDYRGEAPAKSLILWHCQRRGSAS